MSAVVQREMHWNDIAELVELELQLFAGDAWSEATWWHELAERPRRDYVVLQSDSAIVGYAGLDVGGDVADVMTIAIAPAAQGNGHGRTLLEWLTTTAVSAGANALMLEVRSDNTAARGLYASAGFEQISVRRKYYQPGDVDALILRALLNGEMR